MPTWKIWLMAVRPKTLWAAVSPVLVGSAMAAGDGLFYWPAAAIALAGALLIQIGTNFANDYFDFIQGADTGERLGPLRVTQAGLVEPRIIKRAFILVFALAFLIGLYLVYRGGWPILAVGLLSILFGILYTGGPYSLGYNGLGDIFVLIFFGPVAVGGTYYVQALSLNWPVMVAGLGPGLISMALLAVNNLRDIDTDRQAGKRTLAVRYGAKFARMEYLICILLPAIIPGLLAFQIGGHRFAFLTLLALPAALPGMKLVLGKSHGKILNKALENTGKVLFVYGLLFTIAWLL